MDIVSVFHKFSRHFISLCGSGKENGDNLYVGYEKDND